MKDLRARRRFVWGHTVAVALLLLFFLYRAFSAHPVFDSCLLHDRLHLYCALCGGTRAAEALLRGELLCALRYNAFAVLLIAGLLTADAVAWVRFFRKRTPLLHIPPAVWIASACLLVLFFIARNLLLILFGIDPVGDLAPFWAAVMGR